MNNFSNLPPGVTDAMIERQYADEEYKPFRCRKCGAFLKSDEYTSEPYDNNWAEKQTRICSKCGHENIDYRV